ncbi:MAG: hypothetical protein LBG05_05590 [Treponema sp.]|jgi:hypothetical protein|nr:hypothetical protein [Treponema sp.]
MDFELDLAISEDDVNQLTADGMRIIIAKPVGNGEPNVAWLSFQPYEGNIVKWSEEYGLYASTVKVEDRATIESMSEKPPKVLDGKSYLFGNNGAATFSNGTDPCNKGSFAIGNLMSSPADLTFGLTQKAQINGADIEPSFINAVSVPSLYVVTFTPLTRVYVWLENSLDSGTVITDIRGQYATVDFGGSVSKNKLLYDKDQGGFVPASDSITVHKPTLTPIKV